MKIKLDKGVYMPERGDENDTWWQKHKIISKCLREIQKTEDTKGK